jgi:hypothetical protein
MCLKREMSCGYFKEEGYLGRRQLLAGLKSDRMKLETPTSFVVVGGTMCNMIHWVWNLLNSPEGFDMSPSKIIYCYPKDQPVLEM